MHCSRTAGGGTCQTERLRHITSTCALLSKGNGSAFITVSTLAELLWGSVFLFLPF